MRDAMRRQHRANLLRRGDRPCADQHRPPAIGHHARHHRRHRLIFRRLIQVAAQRHMPPPRRPVQRDGDHIEVEHRPDLARHLLRCAGHAGEAQIPAEQALIGYPRQRLPPVGQGAAFLGFDQLVQPMFPGPVRHGPPGGFVDNLHRVIFNDVVPVAHKQHQRPQRLGHQLLPPAHRPPHPVRARAKPRNLRPPRLGQQHRAVPRIETVLLPHLQAAGDLQCARIHRLLALRRPAGRQHQRRARLIDEHAVRLVHNGEIQPAQHIRRPGTCRLVQPVHRQLHPVFPLGMGNFVAQVIEGDFLVGAIDNVVLIRRRALGIFHALRHHRHAQPEEIVKHPHLRRVPAGEIIVDRNHMHRMPSQRHHRRRQGGGEGFALPGLHFHQPALQQRPAGLKLARVMPVADGAMRRLADQRETFAHQRHAKPIPPQPLAHLPGGIAQPLIIQRLHRRRMGGHRRQNPRQLPRRRTDQMPDRMQHPARQHPGQPVMRPQPRRPPLRIGIVAGNLAAEQQLRAVPGHAALHAEMR